MPKLTSYVLYIYTYISLAVMAESFDSEYHTQFASFVEPGHDLELEPMNAFYLPVPDNVSLLRGQHQGVILRCRTHLC